MARKKRQPEQENHERWLVSYADFITLLFAFFVVMYSISSVNEGKYRVLSDTLTDAFVTSAQSLDPIQLGEQVRTPEPVAGEYAAPNPGQGTDPVAEPVQQPFSTSPEALTLGQIATHLKQALSSFIDKDLVKVTQTDRGIEVEMNSRMLFKSGSARLSTSVLKPLRKVTRILRPLPNQIHVEGHTDNVPINTSAFPSNWELSAARAASVVQLFTRLGVTPERMAAIGYGEFRPVTDNTSGEGRQSNRRVSIIIMAREHERARGEIGVAAPRGRQ